MGTDAWGVDDGWHDTTGRWHAASPEVARAVRSAMGADPDGPAPQGRPVWLVRPGATDPLQRPGRIVLDDGTDLGTVDQLPPDLPLGLHELHPSDDGPTTTLLVSPGHAHLPQHRHGWGATVQVPTTRSRQSWGVGDLVDVRAVATWLRSEGATALALSPLHAPAPTHPVAASPYYPSSRRWRSPLLLRPDALGGPVPEGVARLGTQARALLAAPVVDRDAAWRLQRAALEQLWAARSDRQRDELERWRSAQGASLEGWARYCALADEHGPAWRAWPAALRRPDGPAVAEAAAALADRVAFHAWLQLLVEAQLEQVAAVGLPVIQDLAIGADPNGADAWLGQDLLADGVTVGAPPDDFAPQGQDWGLPPFVPWRLRDAGYRPWAELVRSALRLGGLRVDHVMGLVRLYWIAAGRSPAEGAYVRFTGHELLEVLAMESARAGGIVVGEDLGTVEPGFREALRATGILSTRLAWFEDDPPTGYPPQSLGMVTTHDLPTVAGVCTGADDAELEALGRPAPPEAAARLRERLDRLAGPAAGGSAEAVRDAVHRRLGQGASMLALATLEDLCLVERRPNVPGTTDERPNWSLPLPVPVEDLPAHPGVVGGLRALAAGRAEAHLGSEPG